MNGFGGDVVFLKEASPVSYGGRIVSVFQTVISNFLDSLVRCKIRAGGPHKTVAAATKVILLASCLFWISVPSAAQSSEPHDQESAVFEGFQRSWLGPDGNQLPFRNDSEILEFLRTAEVVSIKTIPTGVTKPQKVLLEKDGVRMNALKPRGQVRTAAMRPDDAVDVKSL